MRTSTATWTAAGAACIESMPGPVHAYLARSMPPRGGMPHVCGGLGLRGAARMWRVGVMWYRMCMCMCMGGMPYMLPILATPHLLPHTTTYYRLLPLTTTYYHVLPLTTTCYPLLPRTTTYHHLLPLTTTYYHSLPLTTDYHSLPLTTECARPASIARPVPRFSRLNTRATAPSSSPSALWCCAQRWRCR